MLMVAQTVTTRGAARRPCRLTPIRPMLRAMSVTNRNPSAREQAVIAARRRVQRLDDAEIEAHLALAFSRDHWRAIAPDLSIEGGAPAAALEARPIDAVERSRLLQRLSVEGWFRADPVFDEQVVDAMRAAVAALVARGWPPVFAYVYDELWQVLRTPSLTALLASALGPGYRLSPRVWAFHVPAEAGAAGWPPHVDGGANTHTTDRITLWIPLGDATLENGCMVVVPKNRLPPSAPDAFANDMSRLSPETWRAMLQGSRPLPARRGSVMGWDFQVIHWSSIVGEAEAPRVSLAVEAFGEHIVPTPSEEPLLDPGELPPLKERLRAIARGLLSYERFEPEMLRFTGLARRLLAVLDTGA
jgi:hypothetical protein